MIAAIIVAAGESRRMGSPKARLPYPEPDGSESTFLSHLLRVFERSLASPVVVVVGHHAETLSQEIDSEHVRIVENPRYRDGMLSSIQAGIGSLGDEVAGALLCPVDHPDIEPSVVDALIRSFEARESPIVLPVCEGRRGHPVLFSRSVFPEIADAPVAVGARQVVWDHENDLVELPVPTRGILVDVDTPTDYRAFRRDRSR